MKVIPDSNAVVIGKYNTNDVFLIERAIGKGKILVYTSTLNTEWGDFPVNEIYLPFIYQLVKYSLESSETVNSFFVGEPVALNGMSGDEWEVKTPDDKIIKVNVDETGTGYFRETETPGNYQATYEDEQRYFSVNVETFESELTYKDETEVLSAVTGPKDQVDNAVKLASLTNIVKEEKNQKFWRYILLLIIMLFLFETYYANRKTAMHLEPERK